MSFFEGNEEICHEVANITGCKSYKSNGKTIEWIKDKKFVMCIAIFASIGREDLARDILYEATDKEWWPQTDTFIEVGNKLMNRDQRYFTDGEQIINEIGSPGLPKLESDLRFGFGGGAKADYDILEFVKEHNRLENPEEDKIDMFEYDEDNQFVLSI